MSCRKINIRLSIAVLLTTFLNGCLVSSPYHGQVFSSRTDRIPMQVWSNSSSHRVLVECHRASQRRLYEPMGDYTWQRIDNNLLWPSTPSRDSGGNIAHGWSANMVLPDSCWHRERTPDGPRSKTALRFKQQIGIDGDNRPIYRLSAVFDKLGLACAGQAIGATGLWSGYLNANCNVTYDYSTQALPFLIIESPS